MSALGSETDIEAHPLSFLPGAALCQKATRAGSYSAAALNSAELFFFAAQGTERENRADSVGNTTKVRRVAEIRPPMTTVAMGRWTSASVPVDRAMGTNPSEATNAVIVTGRNRVRAPS
jgi:hypothetical protein